MIEAEGWIVTATEVAGRDSAKPGEFAGLLRETGLSLETETVDPQADFG